MTYLLYAILLFIIAYTSYRSYKVISVYKNNDQYIKCYKQVLIDPIESYIDVCAYVDSELNECFINKGKILKLYVELCKNLDYRNTLEEIDLKKIFLLNNEADKKYIDKNADSFIWLILVIVKAHFLYKKDVLTAIREKIEELKLNDRVEVLTILDTYEMFNMHATKFYKDLLEGNYSEYKYDRDLVGIFKRIAASNLVYMGETIDEISQNDLISFAGSKIGTLYMKDLGIHQKYITKEEE